MARSRADAANTYDQLLHPFDGWTFGAYAHEAGQFGIGEAKGAVNMVAGAIVDTSPALMLADGMTGSRLSHPIVSVGESQEDGEATFPWVVAAASGVEALAAAPEAAEAAAGAESRAASSPITSVRYRRIKLNNYSFDADGQPAIGQFDPRTGEIEISRMNVRKYAQQTGKSPRQVLYETYFHEAFHKKVLPFERALNKLGFKDPYLNKNYETFIEKASDIYGNFKSSRRLRKR